MRISRSISTRLNYILDELVPPFIRDFRFFMYPLLWIVVRHKTKAFMDFKERALSLSEKEFVAFYEEINEVLVDRLTDLNDDCVDEIIKKIIGPQVLEVGCGRGFLALKLSQIAQVTALDIAISKDLREKNKNIKFFEGSIERIPFEDQSFDTVVCTHTLEHVQDIFKSISELRRVTKKRLIIVVPRERPYKYTPNLHLHFFPYKYSLLAVMGPRSKGSFCEELGGDWFYCEDV